MRYGLHPLVRRVWSLKGLRVITPVERRFEWGYLFGAMQVSGGELPENMRVITLPAYSSELNPI